MLILTHRWAATWKPTALAILDTRAQMVANAWPVLLASTRTLTGRLPASIAQPGRALRSVAIRLCGLNRRGPTRRASSLAKVNGRNARTREICAHAQELLDLAMLIQAPGLIKRCLAVSIAIPSFSCSTRSLAGQRYVSVTYSTITLESLIQTLAGPPVTKNSWNYVVAASGCKLIS